MVLRFAKITLCFLGLFGLNLQAQNEGVQSPKYKDYKSDSSFKNFSDLRFKVARAQINALKNGGALLVRLKTNAKTIDKLKAAGNSDLATQLELETYLKNKIIMDSYRLEFKFCPVYFFFSEYSDSVKYKKLDGIFLDSTLNLNSSIVCNAPFYLIAESDYVYNSSLGIVNESIAAKAIERGEPVRNAAIVLKNRYFIQLHKPFPYFQIKGRDLNSSSSSFGLVGAYMQWQLNYSKYKKIAGNSAESKKLKKFREVVAGFDRKLEKFYKSNLGFSITPEISEFVY